MTSPLSRAEQVRWALKPPREGLGDPALPLIPEGAIILTAAEAEQVADRLIELAVQLPMKRRTHSPELDLLGWRERRRALLSAGQPGQAEK